jgi:hypothetical protein
MIQFHSVPAQMPPQTKTAVTGSANPASSSGSTVSSDTLPVSSNSLPAASSASTRDKVTLQNADKQDPQTTANKILDFVNSGIEQLKKSGASDERLNSRLEAARSGIERGYKEATDKLSSMGLLTDDLQTDINNSRALVDERLSSLDSLAARPPAAAGNSSQLAIVAEHASWQQNNQMSMQILTRDGDKVTVSFQHNSAMQGSFSAGGASLSAFSNQQFEISVDGQLDNNERQALNDLFDQVGKLGDQFFGGDLGSALESAMSLGYDAKELASFSLDLRQSSFAQRTRQYQPMPVELPTPELQSLKAPLAQYADSYLTALQRINPLGDSAQLLDQLMAKMVETNDSRMQTFQQFNQGIRDIMESRQQAG